MKTWLHNFAVRMLTHAPIKAIALRAQIAAAKVSLASASSASNKP